MSTVPEWNADIITPEVEGEVEIQANGGLEKDSSGAIGVKVDGETIVVNQEGALEANIPTPDTVDQVFDATSTHAQSGVAISAVLPVFGTTSI